MQTRMVFLVLAVATALPAAAGAAELDAERYMPLREVRPGMTGSGRTTLKGNEIVEFQAEVLAVIEKYGPKQDLIVCRCAGAGLEKTGVISGMSGSPIYINGRLIGAVAYAFRWSKVPICGVQPIEQMLSVTDRWRRQPEEPAPRPVAADLAGPPADRARPAAEAPVAVPASALADAGLNPRTIYRMHPIRAPVMVSGLPQRVLARLTDDLAPYGLVPMAGGGTEREPPPAARLEAGAPLAVPMLRGDIQMVVMGTITAVEGDRIYGFGHSMLGLGKANYPLMTGVAKVVIPSQLTSFRMGAPAKEVGRLVWDEETGILGRLGDQRAPMVPVTLEVAGPGNGPPRRYRSEMIQSRQMSALLAATVASGGLIAHHELPRDHTLRYTVRVKARGREPLVRENLAVSPNADSYLAAVVRHLVDMTVENPFKNLPLEWVRVRARVEPGRRMAEIEKVRALRNTVRPGGTVPVAVRLRPWRQEPREVTVDVRVPETYPEGTYRLVLCGGDEALRQEQREAPARFHPDDLASLLEILAVEKPRDRLYVRLQRPGRGIAIGRDELPDLPASMRSILTASAREGVTPVLGATVSTRPMDWVVEGGQQIQITVDREAPEH